MTWHVRRAVAATLAALALVAALALLPATAAGAQSGDVQDWLGKINGLRSSRGLAPLVVDGELTALAQGWADHMAGQGRLSHTPNLAAGISSDWSKLGENVGMGPNSDMIWGGFLGSAPHYANLTDPGFTHVGIGVTWVGGTQFVTHRFMGVHGGGGGGGGGGSAPPPPAPRPPRAVAPPTTTAPPPPVEAPPPPPPPPSAEPARVAAVLDALHAVGA
jgi:hypothetical protein